MVLRCPECGSKSLYKDGLRYYNNGDSVQRWLCRNCGYRFSERQNSNSLSDNKGKRQICVSLQGAKNLATVESQSEKRAAGATATDIDVKGKILTYLVYLKNEGFSEETIKQKSDLLYRLLKLGADLSNPESVKKAVASLNVSNSYKLLLCIAYEGFAKYYGVEGWTRPHYKQEEKLPFIPYEEEIDALIAGCGPKTAVLLRLLKETGMRFGEAWRLKWTDVDVKNNVVTCNAPEKGSKPRMFRVSVDLMAMIGRLKRNSDYVLGGAGKRALLVAFRKQKRALAYKLQNPRLNKITFHTIRHWKATTLYHETKDILYVMKFLGHKDVKNTLIYIDLERACFPKTDDSYHVRVAETQEEITSLLEAGFEFVLQKEGLAYFRKRK